MCKAVVPFGKAIISSPRGRPRYDLHFFRHISLLLFCCVLKIYSIKWSKIPGNFVKNAPVCKQSQHRSPVLQQFIHYWNNLGAILIVNKYSELSKKNPCTVHQYIRRRNHRRVALPTNGKYSREPDVFPKRSQTPDDHTISNTKKK